MNDKYSPMFRVMKDGKLIGYDRLGRNGWEWMCPELNPDEGERWSNGVIAVKGGVYDQLIGIQDRNRVDIYQRDIIKYAVKRKICPVCAKKEITSELTYGISKFCPQCGAKLTDEDFITIAEVIFYEAGFAYRHDVTKETYQAWPLHAATMYIEWAEVIGNTHANSNLLKIKAK